MPPSDAHGKETGTKSSTFLVNVIVPILVVVAIIIVFALVTVYCIRRKGMEEGFTLKALSGSENELANIDSSLL